MNIVGRHGIDRMRWRPVGVIVGLTVTVAAALGGTRVDGVASARAEEGGSKGERAVPAEGPADGQRDPADVQRRQQIKQQATHWEQQLTKVLHGDLEMIRNTVGDIPRQARSPIVQAGEKAVKEAALRLAELQFGGPRRPGGGAGQSPDHPLENLSNALVQSLSEQVGREEAAAFNKQIIARRERRRQVAVREIVAVLDGELFLTAEQRERIERSLDERWDDAMALSLEGVHWADDRRVFPGLPADCIVPHLSEAQQQRFVPSPNGGGEVGSGAAVSNRLVWSRMNVLNNVQPTARDPWWFQ